MSIWRRLFKKTGGAQEPRRTAKDYCQCKLQCYLSLIAESRATRQVLARIQAEEAASSWATALLEYARRTVELTGELCRDPQPELTKVFAGLAAQVEQALNESAPEDRLKPLLLSTAPGTPASPAACRSLQDLLDYACTLRQQEMFCLSLKCPVTRKDAVSLVTGRLVPILVIDAGGGLGRDAATVSFEDVTSLPYRAFLTGMMSIPWPKARPVDMKGFISVVGVTSTTPRAEDQLQKTSLALLSRNYMNFSLCLGYHASTVEAYVDQDPADNFVRFHYQGGAASVERRVRRLRLIQGILSRLGFEVGIEGDLLDARRSGEPAELLLHLLEILGRLEVFTKQMDMVMTDDEVVYGYVEDFLAQHC